MAHTLSLPVLVLAILLQTTFMPQIRIFGGQPDLVLLVVLAWAIYSRLEVNVTWAFVGGIASDVMSAAPTGASVIGLLCMVFFIDRVKEQLFGVNIVIVMALTLLGTVVQQTIFLMVLAFSGFSVRLVEQFFYVMLPTLIYNVVFIIPIYMFVRRIQRGMTERSASGRMLQR